MLIHTILWKPFSGLTSIIGFSEKTGTKYDSLFYLHVYYFY